jgi:NAD(P)-dependent dehydrogenase (short-subunit alcohol dehydrogenase family)
MDRDDQAQKRREALKKISGGLILAAAGPGLAQQETAPNGGSTGDASAFLPDFPTEYPKPPFPKQQQPWPGLASKMTPRPDHGETSYRGSGRLTGRKALVTGGDSGMGRAAAIAFAREGADVAINYLPQEEPDASEVIDLIRRAGRKGVALPGDIREESFCVSLVEKAAVQLGGLDLVVSNAARQVAQKSILEISTEQFDATFKTNVYAMFWILKAAVARMKPGSTIICTASINAYDPSVDILDYAATKGAIAIFVKGLAKQLASKGIRVNAVAPGPIWTPLQVTGGQNPDKLPEFGAKTPMGRAGQPAELAPLYVMLADNRASFTTGQIVGATGGESGP